MADRVERYLEVTLDVTKFLQLNFLLDNGELRQVMKKRREFEFKVARKGSQLSEYLAYIQFELSVFRLIQTRIDLRGLEKGRSYFRSETIHRLHGLFARAEHRYFANPSVWIQHIRFAQYVRSEKALSILFAKALRFHTKNAMLWSCAALWEYQKNKNITNARAIMQRALRVNFHNPNMWLAYFKLELMYLRHFREQLEKLGLDSNVFSLIQAQKEGTPQKNNAIDLSEIPEDADDEIGGIPDIAPIQDFKADGDLADAPPNPLSPAELKETPFFRAAIPRSIFTSAIHAIPNDLAFRVKFLEIYNRFENTEEGRAEIYDSLEKDFGQNPLALTLLASRFFKDASSFPAELEISSSTFSDKLSKASSVFERAIEQAGDKDVIVEHFTRFLLSSFDFVSGTQALSQKASVIQTVNTIYGSLVDTHSLPASSWKLWIEYHYKLGSFDLATKLARQALLSHPSDFDILKLFLQTILYTVVTSPSSSSVDTLQEIQTTIDSIIQKHRPSKIIDLVIQYFEVLICLLQRPVAFVLDAFKKILGKEMSTRLFPLKVKVIQLVYCVYGLESAHKAFQVAIAFPPSNKLVWKSIIDIEFQQVTRNYATLSKLFFDALQDPLIGSCSPELWIELMKLEMDHAQFEKCNQIRWKAEKSLKPEFQETFHDELLKIQFSE
mmetsp:Transcript_8132/g.13706  ORF Transcript_8132/g.13706 Transcript_8132/m.13706 type:complete len:668 (-) Transcript_8132:91-2094(-)